jgi:hypothetical protein
MKIKKFLNKKFPLISSLPIYSLIFPIMALAQDTGGVPPVSYCPGDFKSIGHILNWFTCLIAGSVVPLLMSIATIMFIWGVIEYVINAEDSAKREEGRNFIIWGIISLFVLVSVWGIIKLLTGTFGFNSPTLVLPQLQQ